NGSSSTAYRRRRSPKRSSGNRAANASGRYPSDSTTSSMPWRSSQLSWRSRNGWFAIGRGGLRGGFVGGGGGGAPPPRRGPARPRGRIVLTTRGGGGASRR